MQSKRLQSTCKDIQQNDTEQCICQGGFTFHKLQSPCIMPCDFALEAFTQAKADKQYAERRLSQ